MRTRFTVFLTAIAALFPATLKAQYACGRNFEFQFLPMSVWGDDILREYIQVGSSFDGENFIMQVNESRNPVSIAAGRGVSFRTEFVSAVGKRCEWFLGARGWLMSGVASLNDTVAPQDDGWLRGARVWDAPQLQNFDDRNAGGLSAISLYSGNRHFAWTSDLFAVRRFGKNPKSSAAAILGWRIGGLDVTRVDAVQDEAYVKDYVPATDSAPGLDLYYFFYRGAQSNANYKTLTGPLLGFNGTITEGKLRIRGTFTQAFVFGRVEHSGEWIDLVDGWFVREMDNGELGGFHVLGELRRNDLSPSEPGAPPTRERVFLPITEVSFDVSFAPKRRFMMGAGVFISAWMNAPVAARWSSPDFNWSLPRATLVYAGIMTVASVRF